MKKYIKDNLIHFIISSVIILLPMPVGLLLRDRIIENIADPFMTKLELFNTFVFIMPPIMLALNWLLLILSGSDKLGLKQSKSVVRLPFYIIPLISCFSCSMLVAVIWDFRLSVHSIACLFIGMLMIILANYTPKARINFTFGIKCRWTLSSERNWYDTHRFAGRVYLICGLFILICALMPVAVAIIGVLAAVLGSCIATVLFAYFNYKRLVKAGLAPQKPQLPSNYKKIGIASTVIIGILIVILCLVMFTGRIDVDYYDDGFAIDFTYGNRTQIRYGDIDSVELIDEFDKGVRLVGFSSAKFSVGTFQNDKLGSYTLYAYTDAEQILLIRVDGEVLCIGLSGDDTAELYERIVGS